MSIDRQRMARRNRRLHSRHAEPLWSVGCVGNPRLIGGRPRVFELEMHGCVSAARNESRFLRDPRLTGLLVKCADSASRGFCGQESTLTNPQLAWSAYKVAERMKSTGRIAVGSEMPDVAELKSASVR